MVYYVKLPLMLLGFYFNGCIFVNEVISKDFTVCNAVIMSLYGHLRGNETGYVVPVWSYQIEGAENAMGAPLIESCIEAYQPEMEFQALTQSLYKYTGYNLE